MNYFFNPAATGPRLQRVPYISCPSHHPKNPDSDNFCLTVGMSAGVVTVRRHLGN